MPQPKPGTNSWAKSENFSLPLYLSWFAITFQEVAQICSPTYDTKDRQQAARMEAKPANIVFKAIRRGEATPYY
jgi:hypothetical protein